MPDLALLRDVPVDGYLTLTDEDAMATARQAERGGNHGTRRETREDALFPGEPHAGGSVAVILADSGLKYLSTDLWE
jgi:cysteine synthase A